MDEVAVETTMINSLWLHAVVSGDTGGAARWELQGRLREADRTPDITWIPSLLETVGILAGLGRWDEARQLVGRMRLEPRTNWKGAATMWGEALAGEASQPLPGIVHADTLLTAMRAELAGDAAAPELRRRWFTEALPSYSITSLSLLRLADWRSAPR